MPTPLWSPASTKLCMAAILSFRVWSRQIIIGARHLTLVGFVGLRCMSANTINLVVRYTSPVIARIEALLRPGRFPALARPTAQRLLGIPVFLLAIAIALPIPFGNILPVIALVVIGLAGEGRSGGGRVFACAAGVERDRSPAVRRLLSHGMGDRIMRETHGLKAIGFQRNGIWEDETASRKIERWGLMLEGARRHRCRRRERTRRSS